MTPLGPFDGPIPPDKIRTVAAAVPAVELRDLRLVGLSCSLKGMPPRKSKTVVDLAHSVTTNRPAEQSVYVVQVHFKLSGAGTDGGAEFIELKASFQAVYSLEEEVPAEHLESFGEINTVHTVWPYFRELVQNITSRMSIPTMTVPLLKVVPPREDEQPDTD